VTRQKVERGVKEAHQTLRAAKPSAGGISKGKTPPSPKKNLQEKGVQASKNEAARKVTCSLKKKKVLSSPRRKKKSAARNRCPKSLCMSKSKIRQLSYLGGQYVTR